MENADPAENWKRITLNERCRKINHASIRHYLLFNGGYAL
jgi:hypothetical protein